MSKKDVLGVITWAAAGAWVFVRDIFQAWLVDKLARQLTPLEDKLFDWMPFLAFSAVAIWLLGYGKLWKKATAVHVASPAPTHALTQPPAPQPSPKEDLSKLLARRLLLQDQLQQFEVHYQRATERWEELRTAFLKGDRNPMFPEIKPSTQPHGKWQQAYHELAAVAREAGLEIEVNSIGRYAENPFRSAPGDEAISDEATKHDYRRCYHMNLVSSRSAEEARSSLSGELAEVTARIKAAGKLAA